MKYVFNIPVSGRLCMYCLFGLWSVLLFLLQVYTSLHCVVNIIGFGHFAVFLFFGEQAQKY